MKEDIKRENLGIEEDYLNMLCIRFFFGWIQMYKTPPCLYSSMDDSRNSSRYMYKKYLANFIHYNALKYLDYFFKNICTKTF